MKLQSLVGIRTQNNHFYDLPFIFHFLIKFITVIDYIIKCKLIYIITLDCSFT